ncbi:MAG TPA: hypothetical protein VG184_09885 [Acidimicrobiales bacterium]|jgi:acetylornithine deacetylase/succinyl-diaminopimelate desuccinylase-like protein|nr:hypothetical protein [Acidimicrobiales bacterium]
MVAGLVARASAAGSEAALAEWVRGWAADRWPEIEWSVDLFQPGRANVVARAQSGAVPELVLYSHLDTTLSGDRRADRFVVGSSPGPDRFETDGELVSGPGVVVAKGPAAAVTVGFARAVEEARRSRRKHDLTLLLAAGGTHRATPHGGAQASAPQDRAGAGVARFLTGRRPDAALVAKAGPPGLLYEEPGAAFLVVRVEGPWAPVMARIRSLPDGGVPTAAGDAVAGVEHWRLAYRRRALPERSQVGREVAVGALRCGLPDKPDLIGGLLELYVYVIMGPEDDGAEIVDGLRAAVQAALARGSGRGLSVAVEVSDLIVSARTDPGRPIVRAAMAAWEAANRRPAPEVRGWTGSTDGLALRAAGVDTVRLGPSPVPSPGGGEALRWSELRRYAQLYAEIARRWITPSG